MPGSAKQSVLSHAVRRIAARAMDGQAEFCGLAYGTHARNKRTNIAPYSYGLAAHARRTYNDVACSGGQGDRLSRRTTTTGGHEARTPRHSGPRVLLIASVEPLFAVRPASSAQSHRKRDAVRGHWACVACDQSDPRNCQMISSTTITSNDVDDLVADPRHRTSLFLGVVMDADLPFFAISEEPNARFPIFGDFGSFCAVSGSLEPDASAKHRPRS